MKLKQEVIGLIPAGGKGSRISPLPCSKELFPIGFHYVDSIAELRPKVVSHYLLERLRLANIKKAYVILRRGKWDIPSYFGDGKMVDMHLAYLMMDLPYGVPYTLDQAYPFIQDAIVALGFPDLIFYPDNAYVKLLAKLEESDAEIVLGLFPPNKPHKTDMVEIDKNGRICAIHIKPDNSSLEYGFENAVWTPVFTEYMHDYVISHSEVYKHNNHLENKKKSYELHVADVIKSAIGDNMRVDSVIFKEGSSIDIGTPEDMVKAIQSTNKVSEELKI